MNQNYDEIGIILVFLVRQQRNLYHQLKILAQSQTDAIGTNSPEAILQIMTARRKLIQKLEEIEEKLRPIRSKWDKLKNMITPQHYSEVKDMAIQVKELVADIRGIACSDITEKLPLGESEKMADLFAGSMNKNS